MPIVAEKASSYIFAEQCYSAILSVAMPGTELAKEGCEKDGSRDKLSIGLNGFAFESRPDRER